MENGMNIGVLMGGWSPERKISLLSGKNVVEGLKKAGLKAKAVELTPADKNEKRLKTRLNGGKFDALFIALHGGFGEDGTLQALLDKWEIPYTGSGALASGLAMHKGCSKLVFEANQVPTAPWQALHNSTPKAKWLGEIKIAPPLVVKPADAGSALGVTIVKNKAQLQKALALAFKYSSWAIVEKYVEGMEATVAVLGDIALPVVEIVPKNDFYDFEARYTPGKSDHIVPARLTAAQAAKARKCAVAAGEAMGCKDYYRVDMIIPRKGEPQVLEVNTAPGMTATSLFPDAAKAAGVPFPKLLKTLTLMAMEKGKKGT
jgi:D-alanine-D-alanine ligase